MRLWSSVAQCQINVDEIFINLIRCIEFEMKLFVVGPVCAVVVELKIAILVIYLTGKC